MQRLVVGSGNAHKVAELEAMLIAAGLEVEVVGLRSFESTPPDVVEDAPTFAGNARLKADGFAQWLSALGEPGQTWVLTDDSGISVDALDGRPGVHSARFSGPGATDARNNRALVAALGELGVDRSAAHYSCVLCMRRVDGHSIRDQATHLEVAAQWPVTVMIEARGGGGFGYDPHAWLDDGRTVAELSADEKATRSHRAIAMKKLLAAWPDQSSGPGQPAPSVDL